MKTPSVNGLVKTIAAATTLLAMSWISIDRCSAAVTIDGGTLTMGTPDFGSFDLVINGGLLDLNGYSISILSLSGSGGAISDLSTSGNGTTALTVSQSANTTYAGVIEDGPHLYLAVTKIGSGALALTGSSTYTGPTTINQGKLVVNGSLVSPVTVNSGGTLGGTGSLTSATVNSGGHLAPGNSPGTLNLSGSLSLLSGAKIDYELGALLGSDEIYMPNGLLALNGQQFSDFNFTPLADFGRGTYTLIDALYISGSLGASTSGTIGDYQATLAVQGNDLVLTVVPEPGTLAMLLAGGFAMLFAFVARSRKLGAAFSGVLAMFAVCGAQAASIRYTVTDLGTLPGYSFTSSAKLNGRGDVAGYAQNNGGSPMAFLCTSGGTLKALGALPGYTKSTMACGINMSSQVVGYVTATNNDCHGFLYSGGRMQDLGTLGGAQCRAFDISDNGQVVGDSINNSGRDDAFLSSGGTMTDLGTLPAYALDSVAYGINNRDQIVGYSGNYTGYHAFLYSAGTMQDLGTLAGYDRSAAVSINESGSVVGYAENSNTGHSHAFLYSGGTMQDLGTLGGMHSNAFGINDRGAIVGDAFINDYDFTDHGFLYENGVMEDLNNLIPSNWKIQVAYDINNDGQIVADGYNYSNGQTRAVLLTPISVPEPGTLGLVTAAVIGLFGAIWRRKRLVTGVSALALLPAGIARADVFHMPSGQTSLQFVTVGDAGNVADLTTGRGAVGYNFEIGKYDVTLAQYCQFLNAVAAIDTYGLWNQYLSSDFSTQDIRRSGSPGSFTLTR